LEGWRLSITAAHGADRKMSIRKMAAANVQKHKPCNNNGAAAMEVNPTGGYRRHSSA